MLLADIFSAAGYHTRCQDVRARTESSVFSVTNRETFHLMKENRPVSVDISALAIKVSTIGGLDHFQGDKIFLCMHGFRNSNPLLCASHSTSSLTGFVVPCTCGHQFRAAGLKDVKVLHVTGGLSLQLDDPKCKPQIQKTGTIYMPFCSDPRRVRLALLYLILPFAGNCTLRACHCR